MRLALLAPIALAAIVSSRPAAADVERYALIIGNNAGEVDEPRLRYAEDDAGRIHDVMRQLGGFRPENMVILRAEDAATARRALISLNDRIRTQTTGGAHSELLVYYSGHADQTALHLGRSAFELAELEQLVRGSAASLRLLILDSCRSGALTRVKGGAIVPAFAISIDRRLASDGVIFLAASSASEDAQESDAVHGSFFTHYLVSGLLGAADQDGDGNVTLAEAYQYTYENTLRASSRTLSGTQHPTFHYELGGQDAVVLTTLGRAGGGRASVEFPDGKSYLVMRGSSEGTIVAEVGAYDRARRLSVEPGRYFVRGRGADFLLEGAVDVKPAERRRVREDELERIEYARLVRKGGTQRRSASSVHAGYSIRTPLESGDGACQGAVAGYALDLHFVSIGPRIGACRSGFDNMFLRARTDELDLELRGLHAWDIGRTAIGVGVGAGGAWLHQAFSIDARAPDRTALAAHIGVVVGASVDLVHGFYSGLEVDAVTYFFQHREAGTSAVDNRTAFALRFDALLLGRRW